MLNLVYTTHFCMNLICTLQRSYSYIDFYSSHYNSHCSLLYKYPYKCLHKPLCNHLHISHNSMPYN